MPDFIDLTAENLPTEHLCCIIRSRKPHLGVETKRRWLCERLREGHVLRKLDAKGCCFIEYAPLESAWVPITGDNFLYLYCLWVDGSFKGQGYARALMESCIAEARAAGKSGLCMLGAKRQKGWLSNQEFAKKFGFVTVDTTDTGYELLSLSFDGTQPAFTDSARLGTTAETVLTVYYTDQCPFIPQMVESIRRTCEEQDIPHQLIHVKTLEQAKALPCPFNNWAVFYNGKFVSVNLMDGKGIAKLLRKD